MAGSVGIVLAAGKGTRMRSRVPKAAHRLCGKPLARHAVDLCRAVGIDRVIVVVGHGAEDVRSAVGDDVEYAAQERQRGTGDATRKAVAGLNGHLGDVVVLQGDTPLVTPETLSRMLQFHRRAAAAATLLSAKPADPGAYGRVVRTDSGAVERIVERRDATPEIAARGEIHAGMYVFTAQALLPALDRLQPDNQQGEDYLTDVIGDLTAGGQRVEAFVAEDPRTALGINDRLNSPPWKRRFGSAYYMRLMVSGVTIVDPNTTYVDIDVQVGQDTVLHPMTTLSGRTLIGSGCEIGPNAQMSSCAASGLACVSGNRSWRKAKSGMGLALDRSRTFDRAAGSAAVKIGNFVELKNADVEDGASIGHLRTSATLRRARSQYRRGHDHLQLRRKAEASTRIGRDAFVGSTRPWLRRSRVGDGAYVAAATPVTEDVPPGALVVGGCARR